MEINNEYAAVFRKIPKSNAKEALSGLTYTTSFCFR